MLFPLYFVIQSLYHYHIVIGQGELPQRYVIEDGFKPAIFGSYSYDPINEVFEPPPSSINETIPDQIVNKTFILSTVVGEDTTASDSNNTIQIFRKRVFDTVKPTLPYPRKPASPNQVPARASEPKQWWAKPKLLFKNFTKSYKSGSKYI